MKLRLRSLETKQTQRIEIPDSSSLQNLKQTLFHTLNLDQDPSSSSFVNLHLSLNRKDELQSESPDEDTLQSPGITNGDLIFFTLNPDGFACSQTLTAEIKSPSIESKFPQKPSASSPDSQFDDTQVSDCANKFDTQKGKIVEKEENLVVEDNMEVDYAYEDGLDHVEDDVGPSIRSFSVPGFLRKVFTEELGDDGGNDHKLLVLAIHAVLLESGFTAFDPVSNTEVIGFQYRNEWPESLFRLKLSYTLPEIIQDSSNDPNSVKTVLLKFQSLGKSVTVYGSLSNADSSVHRVNFDTDKLVPFLNVAWANCGLNEEMNIDGSLSGTSPEKEVFKFWRSVKDELSLPFLIDLCENAGFALPACFIRLPTEIKLKILESLPGLDIGKVSCVCSELRYLASNDELWKKKFTEQFGDTERTGDGAHWKQRFVNTWEGRKRRRMMGRVPVRPARPAMPRRRPPIFGGGHDMWPHLGIIGGDYDRLPQPLGPFGIVPQGGMPPVRRHPQPSHVPRCNLGGSGNRTFT